jgi:hypothetical protein
MSGVDCNPHKQRVLLAETNRVNRLANERELLEDAIKAIIEFAVHSEKDCLSCAFGRKCMVGEAIVERIAYGLAVMQQRGLAEMLIMVERLSQNNPVRSWMELSYVE